LILNRILKRNGAINEGSHPLMIDILRLQIASIENLKTEMVSFSDLSWLSLLIVFGGGLLIGMSKVGVPGVSLAVVPALAFVFGTKQSTGILPGQVGFVT
jgi:hypothetical protein